MYKAVLIDDEYFFRQYLIEAVDWKQLGFEIAGQAHNGIDGLEIIIKTRPEVALVDINMPGMDGLKICERIREARINTKVILITGYAEFAFAQQAMRLGVKNYIAKPVDTDELTAALEAIREQITEENHKQEIRLILERANLYGKRMQKGNMLNALMSPNDDDIFELYPEPLRLQLLKHLRANEREQLLRLLDRLFLRFESEGVSSGAINITCFYVYSTALEFSVDICREIDLSGYNVQSIMDSIYAQSSLRELKGWLVEEISQIMLSASCDANSMNQIDRIKEYICQNYQDAELKIDGIAKEFYLSYNYLCNYFKKGTGTTINDYITAVRLTNAIEMFKSGNNQIAVASAAVGYDDPNYFGKVFKKHYGVSPSVYLQSLGKQPD